MKVISEYKLTQEQIKEYREKGYEVYYGYENPTIKQGEAVGFLLETMFSSTIDTINTLLHRKNKSKITIKYGDKTYKVETPEDWQSKYYEDHKWHTTNHPILEEYYNKRSEYFEHKQLVKAKDNTTYVLSFFDNKIPEDLDSILSTFARLYEVDVDYDNLESKLRAYMNIQFYLENNIEYSRDLIGTNPDEEPLFECISFGDETYLEDMLYQNSEVC